jgi:dipeptidyl aminopeptidase/acylaminoacyl peptidase
MIAAFLAALALVQSTAPAPTTTKPAEGMHAYAGLVITPQGDKVASVDGVESEGRPSHAVVVVRSVKSGEVLQRIDPCPACRYAGLTWSPDGQSLAFVASRTGEALIEVVSKGATHEVTTVKGLAQTPRWSPGGDRLAFLAVVGAHKEVGATQAGVAQVGEIGSVVDEQRIHIVPAAGGKADAVSPADTWIYEYDWMPDGAGFVATAAKGDGDNNWWVAKLVAIAPAASTLRVIATPPVQMNLPRVSPDGKTVAFVGGLMSDFGPIGGDLWTAPVAGGEAHDLTPGFKGSFNGLVWRGGAIRASALMGAFTVMTDVAPITGKVTVLTRSPFSHSSGEGKASFSADGTVAASAVQDFEHAPEIYIHDASGPRALTHDNAGQPAHVHAVNVTWKNGGFDVQGWLLTPVSYDPKVKHPMITEVHGGPSSAVGPSYVARGTVRDLIEHGYFVFQPNPRGSYGQGEAFTRANIKDFGGGDLSDILAGIDAVEKIAPVDEARLGVMGHSYGGFMTMWTVTHSHRFKAAVAGAGIANWSSYYGENGIDQWMVPFFGATFYDDPVVYDRLSPIRTIKTATTPTFIYVGERDVECPAAQSLEFHHGLDAMGVPNSLVIFAGEGHGIRAPEHVKELKDRTLAWFDKYLGK